MVKKIHLPMQETRVQSLVLEDPIRLGATKLVCHNYRACALAPGSCNYGSLLTLGPVLSNKRSHHNEELVQCNYKVASARCN